MSFLSRLRRLAEPSGAPAGDERAGGDPRAALGRAGEEAAATLLHARGMRILARNWRSGPLELDLVCREGDTLVFVEVKTRGPGSLGSALEAVGPRKRQSLIRAHGPGWPRMTSGTCPAALTSSVSNRGPRARTWSTSAMLSTSPAPGHLWIVATPLGNPGDLSPRAREVLAGADLILAEDTRRAGLLCSQCNIPARRFLSFHDHNESERQEEVLRLLRQGQNLALVSDAGTPLLADPGYRLVRACRAEGLPVSPVPGPSAPVTALSAAGIPPLPYTFLGFLPRDVAGRRATLSAFARTPGSLIFFERKDRLRESLAQAAELLGPRAVAVCRELTKTHEEFILGRLEKWQELPEELLGEITVIIGPPEQKERADEAEARRALEAVMAAADERLKPKEVARRAQEMAPGWSAKELYELLTRA